MAQLRLTIVLLLPDHVNLTLALPDLCLVVQLELLSFTLLLLEHNLELISLLVAVVFLLIVPVLLELQALLQL